MQIFDSHFFFSAPVCFLFFLFEAEMRERKERKSVMLKEKGKCKYLHGYKRYE